EQSEDGEDFLVALERRDEIRAGEFGARPIEHFARHLETAVARRCARRLQRLQQRLWDHNTRDFVVEPQRLFVAGQGPDADEHRNRRLASELLYEVMPV